MKQCSLIWLSILLSIFSLKAQDAIINIDADAGRQSVSPYLYGRNNNFSDASGSPTSASKIQLYKEAGLRFARENGGNNATKYNWKRKISSHPDWYNNVYSHDWDYASQSIQTDLTYMQTMWAFQLIGKVAADKDNNFNDWGYNQSQWWSGVAQNLAGGGTVNPDGGAEAIVEGNPDLYLMNWNADSTTGILDHWFGDGGLGLSENNFQYWGMDNEPEIWSGTHDDIMPTQLSASDFMDLYFAVAKKAREKYPEIKLTGPITCNEWQWYKWANESIYIDGKYYCWLEYFLKRVAEEQNATGIRLLDVVDIHWYPSETSNAEVIQSYRIFYDMNYTYPGANGVKTINGGWDNSLQKEYIFQRINNWLNQYFGTNHGITLGLSEFASNTSDVNVNSVLYASMLGTFANNGVEFFAPWTWKTGMWETLHLFSRYSKNTSVSSTSSLEATVSGYTTVNSNADSMTVILVNRDLNNSKNVNVNLSSFVVSDGNYSTLQLESLPSSETFVSHTSNTLKNGAVSVSGNAFTITLPKISTTAVILKAATTGIEEIEERGREIPRLKIFTNYSGTSLTIAFESNKPIDSRVVIYDQVGRIVEDTPWKEAGQSPLSLDISMYKTGIYIVEVTNSVFRKVEKFVVVR